MLSSYPLKILIYVFQILCKITAIVYHQGGGKRKVYTDTIICHIFLSHSWFNPQMENPWIQRANCIFRSGADDPTAQPCFNVPRHNHIIIPRGGNNLSMHAVIKNFLCMYKIILFIQTFFYCTNAPMPFIYTSFHSCHLCSQSACH